MTHAANDTMMALHQAAVWLPGALPVGDQDTAIRRVHTDTRSLRPGDLFVALKGEHHDANQYLEQARDKGAAAAICHPGSGLAQIGLPGLEVPDTKAALGTLASCWRAQFQLAVIAVTGSNGKTTVTQMLASILSAWKPDAMLATVGNLNNDIGVPLTLLRLRPNHVVAVVELGMNHPGEIAHLAAMVKPDVALVNNAQREHLEFMQTVEAVARENGAVVSALPDHGIAVFPLDDPHAGLWRQMAGARAWHDFSASSDHAARVRCNSARWSAGHWQVVAHTESGLLPFRLRAPGRHNLHNALAAITCALAAGVPAAAIRQGLENFEPVKGRSRALHLQIGNTMHTLIDDSYNANPDSVAAALELLASLPPPRLMVLGDMGEVGQQGEVFHAQAGSMAQQLGIEQLFTHGALSAAASQHNTHARHFQDMPDLIAAVLHELPEVASVLVKGSRFMRMERVVEAVTSMAQAPAEENHAA